jgi:hypothetical protein
MSKLRRIKSLFASFSSEKEDRIFFLFISARDELRHMGCREPSPSRFAVEGFCCVSN